MGRNCVTEHRLNRSRQILFDYVLLHNGALKTVFFIYEKLELG